MHFYHEKFSMVIGSHEFTWLTKLSQQIHDDKVIKEVVLKEREDADWEGIIDECKRELGNLSIKLLKTWDRDLGGPIGATTVMKSASLDE